MTNQELEDLRRQKWRLNGNPVRTLEDAREFIESVGFALMYPLKPAVCCLLSWELGPGRMRSCLPGNMRLPIRGREMQLS